MFKKPAHTHTPLCGPDCRYRTLYEGTQSSLADLAGKQAVALNRIGRMRQGLVLLLKATAPRSFSELERHLGMRLSEVDDESLLSCAQWLLEQNRGEPDLHELRAAMAAAGYRVQPTDGVADLVVALGRGLQYEMPGTNGSGAPGVTGGMWAPAQAQGVRRSLADAARQVAATQQPPSQPEAGPPASDVPQSTAAAPASGATQTGFDDVFAPSPSRRTLADAAVMEPSGRSEEDDTVDEPVPEPSALLDEISAPQPAQQTEPDQVEPAPEPETPEWQESPQPGPSSEMQPEPEPDPEPANALTAEPGLSPAAAAVNPASEPRVVRGAPVRPELFSGAARSATLPAARRRRRSRVSAQTPATPIDVPGGTAMVAEPDDEMDAKLLAAVTIPRPVFVSDLTALAGSGDAVEAWIERCRANPEVPLRFIAPKARHRLRGSLVLPVGALQSTATEFEKAWWAACMEKFRGAKLYELAVLLHAIGDKVVSWRISDDRSTVMLRVNEDRGMVGVVVVLGDDLDTGGATRAQMSAMVEELLGDRLALLVTLVTADPIFDPVMAALAEQAVERQWQPACHVVAARSWEWATGNAAAARHILG